MNFFKGCCSSKDAGEPAKKSDIEKKPEGDAAAAEAKAEEAPAEEAPAEAAPEEAPEAEAEAAPAEWSPTSQIGPKYIYKLLMKNGI